MEKTVNTIINLYEKINVKTNKDIIYNIVDVAKKTKERINEKFGIDDTGIRKIIVDIGDIKLKVLTYLADILAKNTNCEYIDFNIEKIENQIKIFAYYDKYDNHNKHITKIEKKEIKANDMIWDLYKIKDITKDNTLLNDFKNFVSDQMKIDINDNANLFTLLNQNCIYEISLITHHPLMIAAGNSEYFKSCHRIGSNYHVGNIQNMLSENVFMACILNSNDEIISRAWIYTTKNLDIFWIGRLYNGTTMPGICIIRAIEKVLNKNFLIKIGEPNELNLDVSHFFGHFDRERQFIRLEENKEVSTNYTIYYPNKIICVSCGNWFNVKNREREPHNNYLCDNCCCTSYHYHEHYKKFIKEEKMIRINENT
jgi:hypothetical protein